MKDFVHNSHTYGLLPVWLLTCTLKIVSWLLKVKYLSTDKEDVRYFVSGANKSSMLSGVCQTVHDIILALYTIVQIK